MRMMAPPPPPPPLPNNHKGKVSTEYIDRHFIMALMVPPEKRTLQDMQHIYAGLHSFEALMSLRDSALRSLCKVVRYERHEGNDVLYYTGEFATCWYILLTGSVYIDGSMFLPRHSFGKRSGVSTRRPNECFVLEPSEMLVIDYPDVQSSSSSSGGGRLRTTMNDGDGGRNHRHGDGDDPSQPQPQQPPPTQQLNTQQAQQQQTVGGLGARPELYMKSNRSSHSSDTSSAYSGSDTMHSMQSSIDQDEVDLSGLVESVVDSDEEDDIASLTVRDTVRECLEKDPTERTDDDIDILLEFTQHLKAFTNMTLAVRRALCSVMVFAVVDRAGIIVMNDREELDSWSVLINGQVEVDLGNGETQQLQIGDSFGITPTMDKLFHKGVMRTKCEDCQFVCITQTDYYKILHQGEENIQRHEENGVLVLVTESRVIDGGSRKGHVVIRGSPERLMLKLIEEHSVVDPSYVEDFLLTHRTFIDSSITVANQLLKWFEDPSVRDKVTRVVLLWVNNHFTDFETDTAMMDFLETFEAGLEREKSQQGQLRLLNIACAAKARVRNVTLTRPSRDEILHFSILGGFERGFGIFISKVDKKSKAEDVGLKRGDQILEVNGQSFEHVSHAKALDILRGTTHLSITVKSNLQAFKDLLQTPENSPRPKTHNKVCEIARLQPDPLARYSTVDILPTTIKDETDFVPQPSPAKEKKEGSHKGFMTLGYKRKDFINKFKKMSFLPKNTIHSDGLPAEDSSVGGSQSSLYHSHSNPDLPTLCYDDNRADYPEHVLKVYRADQSCKYLLVNKETTAHEVVMLALQEFGMTEASSGYNLCEVSVGEGAVVKQRRLFDQLQNLAERIGLSSRYYLRANTVTETLVPDELVPELIRESQVHFLQLNAVEVATQLTLLDFSIFRKIESTEYIDDLFHLRSPYGMPMLSKFAELVNHEMFWVVTEVCSEHNLIKRMKIIKQFIKVARHCKECKNFNSMFAIVSGLGHTDVKRLRSSWEKLPSKYQRLYHDLEDLMDPSRNMSKYRQLISSEQSKPPIIPFYPVVKKDLTFIHLGNHTKVDDLINFEKLRMIAKEVRALGSMCSSPYDFLTMLQLCGQAPSSAMVALNQMNAGPQQPATVKRRKKSTATPNPKKMFEEAQMVRRVKAYLNNMKVITDEDRLHILSLECEPAVPTQSVPVRRRNHSPTLSTTSSTSSTSEGKKGLSAPKFGVASAHAQEKLLSLSEPKTRPHQPRPGLLHGPSAPHFPLPAATSPSPSPSSQRRGRETTRASHERSHSDTPATLPPVDLNAESSSVTSLSNLPLRKHHATSGSSDSGSSVTSYRHTFDTDSGLGDSHSMETVATAFRHAYDTDSNAVAAPSSISPNFPRRRYSAINVGQHPMQRPRRPPDYNTATQMSRIQRVGRAHSHEGVSDYFHGIQHEEEDDDGGQVSAV